MKEREAFSAQLFSTEMNLSNSLGPASAIVSPYSDYLKPGSKGLKKLMRCMNVCVVLLVWLIELVIKPPLLIYHFAAIVMIY